MSGIDPAIVEAARQGILARIQRPSRHWGTERLHPDALPHLAEAAVEFAAPLIAAEALRDLADALVAYDAANPPPPAYGEAAWLRNRADQIAGVDQYEQAWQSRDWDTVRHLQDEQRADQ